VIATLIGVIATLILGVLALFGNQIKGYWFKPNLKPIESVRTSQLINNEEYIYHRLIVKNIGWVAAREVRVLLTYLKPLKNFIPIPLRWTHFSKSSSRDIARGEPAYVDILRKKGVERIYYFCWAPETGSNDPLLSVFNPEYGNLRLEFFERDRKIGDILLEFLELKNDDKLKIS
jgi:hypothetical protein